ncbi:hypothetical protein Cgig2_021292 [Carnegiea gigantea]|uniref:Uncharacterized protein n=1 Tax=Carnegiea gigantea TaxID=171969 RepID=A0A9Q1K504_9CARY|nr:hypothetical protein Cgig2_021292 [Carnegiea gigantea]
MLGAAPAILLHGVFDFEALNLHRCPFCKTSNYAVEYRGMKSKEERGLEEIEEQKVIEAKIRMHQQQLLEEEKRQRRKEEISPSNREGHKVNPVCNPSAGMECEEIAPFQDSRATHIFRPQYTRQNRDDEFDVDLEDIMVMEAIWLSIQENGGARHPSAGDTVPEQYVTGEHSMSPAPDSSSYPSGGRACVIAALAERRQLNSQSSCNYNGHLSPPDVLPSGSSTKRVKKSLRYHPQSSSAMETYSAAEVNEVGMSYASSDEFEGGAAVPSSPPPPAPPLSRRRKSKRVKNDQRKCASLEKASSKDICGERMLEEEWQSDSVLVATEAGTSYGSSNELDEGVRATLLYLPPYPPLPPCDEAAMLPPPPPPLYGGQNSSRVRNNRRRYSPPQRASPKDTCGKRMSAEEWELDYGSVVAEVGTTYGSSDELYEGSGATALPAPPPPPPLYDRAGTSSSCSDDGEDDGDYVALPLPPPPPPPPYGCWPIPSPIVYDSIVH